MRKNNHILIVLILALFAFSVTFYSGYLASTWLEKPFPGFLVYENATVAEVNLYYWNGYKKGLDAYDIILEANNQKISSGSQLNRLISTFPVGTPVNYKVLRNDSVLDFTIKTMSFSLRDFLVIFCVVYFAGIVFFITGLLVYYLKPEPYSSKVFLAMCFSFGIWFTSIFDTQSTHTMYGIPFLGLLMCPAISFQLGLIFPSYHKVVKNKRLVIFAGYLIALLLFSLNIIYHDNPYFWSKIERLFWVYIALGGSVFVALELSTYFNSDSNLEKQKAQIIVLGSLLGFGLPGIGAAIIVLLEISNLNNLAILTLVFPISIAYAIVKHKLFDIDVIIQKTLVYGTLTTVLVGISVLLVLSFNLFFASQGGWRNPVFFIVLSGFLVVAMNPLRDKIQSVIDSAFFRKRYDYSKTISDLSSAMTSILNIDEIAQKTISSITQTMYVSSASFFIFDRENGDYRVHDTNIEDENFISTNLSYNDPLVETLRKYRVEIFKEDLFQLSRFALLKNELIDSFSKLRSTLVIPLFFKGDMVGFLALGDKKSGLMYNTNDMKLLKTLSNQSAIAVENSFAFKLVEDYAKKLEDTNKDLKEAQSQLVQAEKMSAIGQLAAGIAHEIRNPLNIIEGARYYLASQVSYSKNSNVTMEYLDYIKYEVDRTNKLIDRLLRFSKSETPHFETINVNDILENIILLMRKQLSNNKINLETNFSDSVPEIMGDPNQLWQVFINILVNADQAMPNGGDLKINTGVYNLNNYRSKDDQVFISFNDTGIGIDHEDIMKVFDPFFTKKESGTGLGLSVSYKIIEEHNGHIIVNSTQGKGTTFIIELPVSYQLQGEDLNGKNADING